MSIISNNTLKAYGGDVAIGAMTVINAVMILFLMSAMGITQGAQPIIGFNYGAGNRERCSVKFSFAVGPIESEFSELI